MQISNIKQVFLLYPVGSLVILIAYQPYTLVGSLEKNPLAVKNLENRLYILVMSYLSKSCSLNRTSMLVTVYSKGNGFIIPLGRRHFGDRVTKLSDSSLI